MREAILYDKLSGDRVRCNVCGRRCTIVEGKRGFCRTQLNSGGVLYSLNYGEVTSLSLNPIEKKPVFHFLPGSVWLSLGSWGCNFRCSGCQNWEISRADSPEVEEPLEPEASVELALRGHCAGISWTFNEPTIWFEYTLDGARAAKKRGLFTNYVTNGFITREALDAIGPYLDVFRVDVKGFSDETYERVAGCRAMAGVLESAERAKVKWGMHVEVVTNVIPGYNDDERELRGIARWILERLGHDAPWHITRFYPCLELSHIPPTPIETLESVREIGLSEGLRYVYLGNVPGHPAENTYCYICGRTLIERRGLEVIRCRVEDGRCPHCGASIFGKF
ncbi:MAG: AmmeMemoRadiSam system radical SAM enzyme [bacterium]